MKVEKNRVLNFRLSDLSPEDIYHRLGEQLDGKAVLLWISANVGSLIRSGYLHSITLEESTENYYCRMIVRYSPQFDHVTTTYFEKRF